jgi:NADPH-dependent glutamate synthase beta subunit-like oxidoreductase
MGFTGPEPSQFLHEGAFKPDPDGRLEPGLYVTGDAARGPSLVVRAIADGLKTAAAVLADFLVEQN